MPYRPDAVVLSRADPADDIRFIQKGPITLSVHSRIGREAAMLAPGDAFGDGATAGRPVGIGTATTMTASSVLDIGNRAMARPLHEQSTFAGRLIPRCPRESSATSRTSSISS